MHTYRHQNGADYLTRAQAALYVGHDPKWLKARVQRGILEEYALDGNSRTRYFKRKELDALTAPHVIETQESLPEDVDMLTLPQVAHRLQVAISTVHKWKREGTLAVINLADKTGQGAILRVRKEEYARFVEERVRERVRVRVSSHQ